MNENGRHFREIGIDESDEVLWHERYIFNSLSAPGQLIYRDSKPYIIVGSSRDGWTVRTTVRDALLHEQDAGSRKGKA